MERVPLHVLTNARPHHTETEQSPTRAYTAKLTRAAFTVASLSPPGWEKINRWRFLKALLEGKHLSCMDNELRTKQKWHPTWLLNYHWSNNCLQDISKLQFLAQQCHSCITYFPRPFLPLKMTILTPFLTKYIQLHITRELHYEACLNFPLLSPASMCSKYQTSVLKSKRKFAFYF